MTYFPLHFLFTDFQDLVFGLRSKYEGKDHDLIKSSTYNMPHVNNFNFRMRNALCINVFFFFI